MGCDIHPILERKYPDGKWVGVDLYATYLTEDGNYFFRRAKQRNYARFAALAGVRGEGPDPRGIPDDASDLTRTEVEQWGDDGHSHSWLPLDEAMRIFLATDDHPIEMLNNTHPRTRDPYRWFFDIERYEVEGDDEESRAEYRLVFWFDN